VFYRKRDLLTYSWPGGSVGEVLVPDGLQFTQATEDIINSSFANDPSREKTFKRFVHAGYCGYILHNESEWVNYGWMSPPGVFGPPHLPDELKKIDCYWLFYQHTKKEYRGRGYYKLSLKLQLCSIMSDECIHPTFIDTTLDNIASRRGILTVGFEPKGIIHTREVHIPKVKSWIWGYWDLHAEHPGI